MFNSFPYDEWSETITDFWTWGGHNSTGTYIQTRARLRPHGRPRSSAWV